jgi:hypothetical protein
MNNTSFSAFASLDEQALILALPGQAPAPFDHVMLDWNPDGHPGPGYGVAHFDFHFYFDSPEDVAAIPFNPAPTPVDAQWVAPGYIPDMVVVPGGGLHYLDVLAPEFSGEPFTSTFIYGYNDGRMSFLEPMITYATLQAGGSQSFNVRQPSAYQRTGYYPSEYGYAFDGDIYDVYLGGLSLATSPVPEPSTYGLAAAATLGFGLYLRRRRQWRARKTRREPLGARRPARPSRQLSAAPDAAEGRRVSDALR